MRELVVCRYNESLNWLWDASKFVERITVYNKGEPMSHDDPLKSIVEEVCLENVGREAHSILTHIVRRYDTIADETFFCQGDPFPHCKDYLNKLSSPMHSLFEYQTDLYAMTDWEGKPWMGDYEIPMPEVMQCFSGMCHEYGDLHLFGAYSQFSIKKTLFPDKFHFERLLKALETTYRVTTESLEETTSRNQRAPWALERLWMQIFC